MTLYELGMEYLQQDVALRRRVAQLKQKLPQLRGEAHQGNGGPKFVVCMRWRGIAA